MLKKTSRDEVQLCPQKWDPLIKSYEAVHEKSEWDWPEFRLQRIQTRAKMNSIPILFSSLYHGSFM